MRLLAGVLVLAAWAQAAPSIPDVCAMKPAREKGESLSTYGARVTRSLDEVQPMLSMNPDELHLLSTLRLLAEMQARLPKCELAERWENEGFLNQQGGPPADGIDFVVRTPRARADLELAVAVKKALGEAKVLSHVRLAGVVFSEEAKRVAVRVRVAPSVDLAAVERALAASGWTMEYAVRVTKGKASALMPERLRAFCKAFAATTGTSVERLAAVEAMTPPELRGVVAAGKNLPPSELDAFLRRALDDCEFREPCR